MKQRYTAVLALSVMVVALLGCSKLDPFSSRSSDSGTTNSKDRSLSDKAVDTAVGESKIGVKECDDVMDEIRAEMNNPDDNFITKAAKATILNRIKDSIRESVEKNKQDKEELAKTCREFKVELEKYKSEEANTQKK